MNVTNGKLIYSESHEILFLWVLSDFITIGLITSVENDIKINAIIRYSKH